MASAIAAVIKRIERTLANSSIVVFSARRALQASALGSEAAPYFSFFSWTRSCSEAAREACTSLSFSVVYRRTVSKRLHSRRACSSSLSSSAIFCCCTASCSSSFSIEDLSAASKFARSRRACSSSRSSSVILWCCAASCSLNFSVAEVSTVSRRAPSRRDCSSLVSSSPILRWRAISWVSCYSRAWINAMIRPSSSEVFRRIQLRIALASTSALSRCSRAGAIPSGGTAMPCVMYSPIGN